MRGTGVHVCVGVRSGILAEGRREGGKKARREENRKGDRNKGKK